MSSKAVALVLLVSALALGCGKSSSVDKAATKAAEKPKLTKLGIEDLKVGTGPAAANGDTLVMEYTGTLADGTQFDTSKKEGGQAFSFTLGVGAVVQGWDKGLVGMKVGGKRRLSIPSELGYGAQGQGSIPANSDLYFDVEMIDIVKPADRDVVFQYEGAEKPGTGPAVKNGDKVRIKYTGTTMNGTVFDSTEKNGGKPFDFTVGKGEINPGIDVAVVNMKAGGKRRIRIPAILAGQLQGMSIPRDQPAYFDIELVKILASK